MRGFTLSGPGRGRNMGLHQEVLEFGFRDLSSLRPSLFITSMVSKIVKNGQN